MDNLLQQQLMAGVHRVLLTYENLADDHDEWFEKDSSDLAPLNSKCGGTDDYEEWRERLQVQRTNQHTASEPAHCKRISTL